MLIRLLACIVVLSNSSTHAHDDRPDVILILADDVGIEGLGCYGGTSYQTPNLDRMAAAGVRFTTAYSQPLCTPTRIQLMTGRYNHRNWRSFGILDPNEHTFGHSFQQAGYATGIFGKWQLQSYDPPDLPGAEKRRGTGMHPKDAGFDRYSLFHALHTEDKGSRYANPTMLQGQAKQAGTLKTYPTEYGEDVWVRQILKFLDDTADRPSFVYYPMALPHWPFQPTPDSADWNPDSQQQPTDLKYAADMIEYMDTSVGTLLQQLKQRGKLNNTIVIFYSDNGTHTAVHSTLTDGRTIAGGKATTLQTAIHVPLIVHCPDRYSPSVCHDIVDASDFFPTLMEIAGIETSPPRKQDGISFASALTGQNPKPRETAFFWYDPRPGWDKERFRRSVFAINRTHKRYRNGRLVRLTDRPLEETTVDLLDQNMADQTAAKKLKQFTDAQLQNTPEPSLKDAYGKPLHDLVSVPDEAKAYMKTMLKAGDRHSYGTEPEHKLWLYQPLDLQPSETRPCVFLIHGGGWAGQPESLAPQALYLARQGYIAALIHFRPPRKDRDLTPQDTLSDVRQAYRWFTDRHKQFQVDPANIVVSGGSAGGHLSLAMLTIGDPDQLIRQPMPRGLVLFNPVIDLVDGWTGGQKKCRDAGMDPASFSPAHAIQGSVPPTLIMSGTKDHLITPPMLAAFQQRMQQHGNKCEVVLYPDASHSFFNFGRHENQYFQSTMWRFEQFLNQVVQ